MYYQHIKKKDYILKEGVYLLCQFLKYNFSQSGAFVSEILC